LLLLSIQSLFPRITATDISSISHLESSYGGGKIVAEPSLSEYVSLYAPSLSDSLVTSLYYENLPKGSIMPDALRFLMLDKSLDKRKFIADSNISYIILNYEDFALRDSGKLSEENYLDKVYSLSYYANCPFPFLGKQFAPACNYDSTEILKVNTPEK